jgi:Fur family ferric uptake transcriptional regulator
MISCRCDLDAECVRNRYNCGEDEQQSRGNHMNIGVSVCWPAASVSIGICGEPRLASRRASHPPNTRADCAGDGGCRSHDQEHTAHSIFRCGVQRRCQHQPVKACDSFDTYTATPNFSRTQPLIHRRILSSTSVELSEGRQSRAPQISAATRALAGASPPIKLLLRFALMKKSATASPDQLLQSIGLRRTPVRMGVLSILTKAKHPMDVPSILEKLGARTEAVTVYRTLNTFTRKKVIHRVRGDERSWRYAMGEPQDTKAHRHPHFVCDQCGKVDCLSDAVIPANMVRLLGVSSDYWVSYPEVVLHGLCPNCRPKTRPGS